MKASPIALPELLCLIASHLDYQDYRQCVLVSKEWNVAFSPHLWSTVHVCGASKAHCVLPCAKALVRLGTHVRRVYAPRFLNSAGYLFYQQLAQHCPHLEEIHAYVPSRETWEMLLQILQGPRPPTDQIDEQAGQTLDPQATAAAATAETLPPLHPSMHKLVMAHPTVITTLDLEIEEERGFSVCDLLKLTPELQHLSLNIVIGLSLTTLDNVLALCPKLDTFTLECNSYEYPSDRKWPSPLRSPSLALRTLHLRGLNAYALFCHNIYRVPILETIKIDLLEPKQAWPPSVMFQYCPLLQNVQFSTATTATCTPSSPEDQELNRGQIDLDDMEVVDLMNMKVPRYRLRSLRLETTGMMGIEAIVDNQYFGLNFLDIGRVTQIKAHETLSSVFTQCRKLERISIDSIMADANALKSDDLCGQRRRFDLESFLRPILAMRLPTNSPHGWVNKTLRTLKIPVSGPCIFHRRALDIQTPADDTMDVARSVKVERELLAALGMLEQLEELNLVCQECCTDRHFGRTKGMKSLIHSGASNGYEESGGLEWSLRSGLESLAKLRRLRSVRIILAPSPPHGSGRRTRRVEPDVLEWMLRHWPRLTSFRYVVLHGKLPGIVDLEAREEQDRNVDSHIRQWLVERRPASGYSQRSSGSVTTVDMHLLPLFRK
ncbi:hypothetical protein BGZ73_005634 [Actinomortierella ambigua]|nr:hypothetical protein BGZ73_005634 [Actinomortierella ambigua]